MYTVEQIRIIHTLGVVFGGLTAVLSIGAIMVYMFSPQENRGFAKKLLLWAACTDLYTALVIVGIGLRRVSGDAFAVTDDQCATEGFLLVYTVSASLLWNLLLALHMHRKMVAEKQENMKEVVFELSCGRRAGKGAKIKKRDIMAHTVVWGAATLIGAVPLVAGFIFPSAGYARTAGGDLCLVGKGPERHWWRLAFLFLPLVIVSAVCIGLYSGVVRRIREGMRTAMSSTAKNNAVYNKLRSAAARVAAYPTMLLLLSLSCMLSWLASLLSKETDTVSFLLSAVALVMVLAKGLVAGILFVFNAQNTTKYGKFIRRFSSGSLDQSEGENKAERFVRRNSYLGGKSFASTAAHGSTGVDSEDVDENTPLAGAREVTNPMDRHTDMEAAQ